MATIKDSDRILGKLEEFQEWAKKEFESISNQFEATHEKINDLNKYRWISTGKSGLIFSILMIVVEIVLHKTLFAGG